RNWLKNASKFLNKKEPEIHEKVNYNWSEFYQNILFKFLNLYQKQFEIDKYIGSITFMIGFSLKSNNKNQSGEKVNE
ncbi:MAG: hypothetical protein ACTSRP_25865, partial [Candidatus Helarchaeota archaeon]